MVAKFCMITGHDYLSRYLNRLNLVASASLILCDSHDEMDNIHLLSCSTTSENNIIQKYWKAMLLMMWLFNAVQQKPTNLSGRKIRPGLSAAVVALFYYAHITLKEFKLSNYFSGEPIFHCINIWYSNNRPTIKNS